MKRLGEQKKQVAVIDVGSSEITAVFGERGVNNTFLIKGKYVYPYDGFCDGEFFSEKDTEKALKSAAEDLLNGCADKIKTVYIGVPGEFTSLLVKDSQISFSRKKKINDDDLNELYESAFASKGTDKRLINRSPIVYELDDFRRLADPVGETSEILKGRLSFMFCDNYFCDRVIAPVKAAGFEEVELVSVALAEAMYLIDPEARDRLAVLLDVGHITTTLSVIQGDGILCQKSFPFGGGYITGALAEKFDIDFDVAEGLKRQVNLCAVKREGKLPPIEDESGNLYDAEEVRQDVLDSIDVLCEQVSDALIGFKFELPDYVKLLLTGGGITFLRGAKEHLSKRLDMIVEVVSPKVPLMDKPTESEILSLMDLVL